MNINRTPAYGTNFKSTVIISNWISADGNEKQKKVLSDKKVQEELDKLRNNGNDDVVYLFDYTTLFHGNIAMSITEKSGNVVKNSSPGWIDCAEDVAELYKEGKDELKDLKGSPVPDGIADYIIV